MTEANKHQYNLIQQYLNGTLDTVRMHELEKEALEDPFLAEALEGYSKFSGSVQPHLSLLQRQLEARITENVEKKNVFYFTWQRISVAAAASLLFISASILFWMKGTNTESRIAGDPKKVEVNLTPDEHLGKEDQALAINKSPATETKVSSRSVDPGIPSPGKSDQRLIAGSNSRVSSGASEKAIVKSREPARVLPVESLVALADNAAGKASMQTTSGVADTQSALKVPNTLPQEASRDMLFETNVVSARMHSSAKGYQTVHDSIQPANGWRDFNTYIKENKRLPSPAGEEKTVTLIFAVDSLGKPATIRVEKGINVQYDAEAVRLVKEGPLWKVNGTRIGRVKVDFKD